MNVTLMGLAALCAVFGQTGTQTTRVAVINVPKVSEQYARTADLEADFDERRRVFQERRTAARDKIDRHRRSLREDFKPGTPEFEQRRKELWLLEANAKYYEESESENLEKGLAQALHTIYTDIQRTVEVVAKDRGIDVVLACDEFGKDPAVSANAVRQQIMLQKVIYWNPQVDITAEVVTRLNIAYAALKSMSNTGSSGKSGTNPGPPGRAVSPQD